MWYEAEQGAPARPESRMLTNLAGPKLTRGICAGSCALISQEGMLDGCAGP
jgi:hypothetical protein